MRYAGYLEGKHNDAVSRVGGRKVYDYSYSLNGFSAELTPEQAEALKKLPGVLSVEKDTIVVMDTSFTPRFLGLDAPGGLWEQLGGKGNSGDDIIIGVIDSGIWPESPSFSDRTGKNGNGRRPASSLPAASGWHGNVSPGEHSTRRMCNQKLIGARGSSTPGGAATRPTPNLPWEFLSPRDYNGHGTHTASTAAGNSGVAGTDRPPHSGRSAASRRGLAWLCTRPCGPPRIGPPRTASTPTSWPPSTRRSPTAWT